MLYVWAAPTLRVAAHVRLRETGRRSAVAPLVGGGWGLWWVACLLIALSCLFFFFQAEDGIRDLTVTGVKTCALPISLGARTGDCVREHGGRSVAQRRGDPRRVEPVGAREHPRPVDGTRLDASQRGTRAVVHDAHGAQVRARLDEVDPEALTTPLDPFGTDSFPLERCDARMPDGIVGYARDVVASHAEMAQGDRHVRFCSAEAGHEVARLEQSFFPGRAEPQEQLAECDHPRHGVLPRWRRASATRSTNDRARAVSSAAEPSASRTALASAPPTLTAAAPARIQSPAFSSDTPPEGTSRRNGSGASTSRR